MTKRRTVEVFSAGCPACAGAIQLVEAIGCGSCDITVLDMHDAGVAKRAKQLGVRCVPAVVVDGRMADCCSNQGLSEAVLREAGLGSPSE